MKYFVFFIFFTSLLFSACEDTTDKNIEPVIQSNATFTQNQEFYDFVKQMYNKTYEFKNITFVKGSLNDALKQAKAQNKYLFVVSYLEGCSLCDHALSTLDFNKQGISKDTFDKFLFYKCNFETNTNKPLFWAYNSIASPTGFLFSKEGNLINMTKGAKEIISGEIFNNIDIVNETQFSKRLNLKGQQAIDFINKQLIAYNILIKPESSNQELTHAYHAIKQTLNQENTYFNYYLYQKLIKRLDLKGDTKETHLLKDSKFNDDYSAMLFEDLN